METEKRHLVCNDCGCRFEAGAPKEAEGKKAQPAEPPPKDLCPECKSMNLTSA